MSVQKATIINLSTKKDQQIIDDLAMTSSERIDKMFQLMELCADLKPSRTLLDSSETDLPYIILKPRASDIMEVEELKKRNQKDPS